MNSYLNLTHWISDAKEMGNDGISILITGNKKDKENERIIEPEEAANFSGEHGCLYQETSALFGSNVDDLFQKIAKSITYQIENSIIVI
jgi:GTPase SAR1 family protein